jgi:hypothetical protein
MDCQCTSHAAPVTMVRCPPADHCIREFHDSDCELVCAAHLRSPPRTSQMEGFWVHRYARMDFFFLSSCFAPTGHSPFSITNRDIRIQVSRSRGNVGTRCYCVSEFAVFSFYLQEKLCSAS